ncbi:MULTISPECIES: 6-phosphogluconolactonase [unclassified Arthrobacter]|uniref:6-phosphogluconolactonase n=1 Tax=unclassified Arthrobacter TaxID=235627 RepID=UPI001490ED09|nr:6-phosphogluconolactonase [Arthrobacter sp. AET 35A]MBE0010691.1 6-phosphogluconolactonase [Arthrobacter sp. AET 35A]NOJ64686.1 6-phosphogluconolactonase [Arthrobacter sp. 147(2020)]
MNAEPKVSIHPDSSLLAATVAARLITRLVDVQNERGSATVVLTGGALGTAALAAVADSPACSAVDWSRVDFWWGDERFLSASDPDRNAVQARQALLGKLGLAESQVHEFGSSDDFADQDAAAADYAARLQDAADAERALANEGDDGDRAGDSQDPRLPRFDVLLLGVGPDAHIASLFPEMPGIRTKEQTVVGVADAPKPPPLRISLTLEALNSAQEIWIAAGGQDKAGAVGLALAGAGTVQVPASGARGQRKTLWLIDQEAAAQLPGRLIDSGDEEPDDEAV